MKLAIMQPYFLPYLGYFQLINAVDEFIVYDNIQYTKKGWFNRNRYLKNGKDDIFTIPLKKDSDYLDVNKRIISETFERKKLISQLQNAYCKAPYFKDTMSLITEILNFSDVNLFKFIYNSIFLTCKYLEIKTPLVISSAINCNHTLKGQERVIEICRAKKADTYINAIGGVELYDKVVFKNFGIDLKFIKMNEIKYKQFNNEFVPNLSILDVLMFNPPEKIKLMLNNYELI